MNHNMLLHLIIIHFQHPRTIIHNRHIWWLCQNNNIYIYPPHSPPTTFLMCSSLSFLFFCFFVVAQIVALFLFIFGLGSMEKKTKKKKRLKAAGAKGSGALRGERMDRWTDKCMSSQFVSERWGKDQWQRNHRQQQCRLQNTAGRQLWKMTHPVRGSVCACVYTCMCVRAPVPSWISKV